MPRAVLEAGVLGNNQRHRPSSPKLVIGARAIGFDNVDNRNVHASPSRF